MGFKGEFYKLGNLNVLIFVFDLLPTSLYCMNRHQSSIYHQSCPYLSSYNSNSASRKTDLFIVFDNFPSEVSTERMWALWCYRKTIKNKSQVIKSPYKGSLAMLHCTKTDGSLNEPHGFNNSTSYDTKAPCTHIAMYIFFILQISLLMGTV